MAKLVWDQLKKRTQIFMGDCYWTPILWMKKSRTYLETCKKRGVELTSM